MPRGHFWRKEKRQRNPKWHLCFPGFSQRVQRERRRNLLHNWHWSLLHKVTQLFPTSAYKIIIWWRRLCSFQIWYTFYSRKKGVFPIWRESFQCRWSWTRVYALHAEAQTHFQSLSRTHNFCVRSFSSSLTLHNSCRSKVWDWLLFRLDTQTYIHTPSRVSRLIPIPLDGSDVCGRW